MIKVLIKIYSESKKIPVYSTAEAAAFDIEALIPDDLFIFPNSIEKIPTGLYVEIPKGFKIDILSRSGLSSRGISVANSPGLIDSDYRGEIGILLRNDTNEAILIKRGERIAQGLVNPVYVADFQSVAKDELGKTDRGVGGFGSTGSL